MWKGRCGFAPAFFIASITAEHVAIRSMALPRTPSGEGLARLSVDRHLASAPAMHPRRRPRHIAVARSSQAAACSI